MDLSSGFGHMLPRMAIYLYVLSPLNRPHLEALFGSNLPLISDTVFNKYFLRQQ